MNRLLNLALLVLIILGCLWLWKQPEIRPETRRVEEAVKSLPDKAIDAAAKVSNKIEDTNIPEKTENAWNKLKAETKETKEEIKDEFNDAKARDRAKE